MGALAKAGGALGKVAPWGLAGLAIKAMSGKKKGMASMPGQSPLGMSGTAPPGNSSQARLGQRSYLG